MYNQSMVTEAMNDPSDLFPPKELVHKCYALVEATRIPNLPKLIVTRDNMVTLGLQPKMVEILGSASAAFKLRIACWVATAVALCCVLAISPWLLVAAFVAVAVERVLAHQEKKTYKFLAAVLLSLEVLADDFAGWGRANPHDRQKAIEVMGDKRQVWLDCILPRRSNLTPEQIESFGPENRSHSAATI
jgi:hypothetical protein